MIESHISNGNNRSSVRGNRRDDKFAIAARAYFANATSSIINNGVFKPNRFLNFKFLNRLRFLLTQMNCLWRLKR